MWNLHQFVSYICTGETWNSLDSAQCKRHNAEDWCLLTDMAMLLRNIPPTTMYFLSWTPFYQQLKSLKTLVAKMIHCQPVLQNLFHFQLVRLQPMVLQLHKGFEPPCISLSHIKKLWIHTCLRRAYFPCSVVSIRGTVAGKTPPQGTPPCTQSCSEQPAGQS